MNSALRDCYDDLTKQPFNGKNSTWEFFQPKSSDPIGTLAVTLRPSNAKIETAYTIGEYPNSPRFFVLLDVATLNLSNLINTTQSIRFGTNAIVTEFKFFLDCLNKLR